MKKVITLLSIGFILSYCNTPSETNQTNTDSSGTMMTDTAGTMSTDTSTTIPDTTSTPVPDTTKPDTMRIMQR